MLRHTSKAQIIGIGAISNNLELTNFGISVPAGNIIVGIKVDVNWKGSGSAITDYAVSLINSSGVIAVANKATLVAIGTAQTTRTYGGSSDTWGLGLAKADVENSNFGVAIAVTKAGGGSQTVSVAWVSITVYYAASWSQGSNGGGQDIFVTKFTSGGALSWSTYYGGSGKEQLMTSSPSLFRGGKHLAIDASGNVYVTGMTLSTDFPVYDPYPGCDFFRSWSGISNIGWGDAVILEFDNSGVRQWATYMGTSNDDRGDAIAFDQNGSMFLVGEWGSQSTGVPNALMDPGSGAYYQSTRAGNDDSYIVKMSPINCPLPVELLSFTGSCEQNKTLLLWQTTTEINNNYFEIERSSDGKNWETIGKVKGAGNSSTIKNYELTDESPFLPPSGGGGALYYRLKQVDYDGRYEYFGPAAINCRRENDGISIIPNPSSGVFTIHSSPLFTVNSLGIYDMLGKVLYSTTNQQQQTTNELNLSALPSGIYILQVRIEGGSINRKIVISR